MSLSKSIHKRSFFGMLITLGIVYGDIGTSPLYVMNAIVSDAGKFGNAKPEYIIGSISLIFWTLMLITTIKYVIIAMKADNNHEGGIFALYALVRKRGKWLVVPALIGGAALLADGTLTPAVTVTSAIEGLKGRTIGMINISNSQMMVLISVSIILFVLFLTQRFGTAAIGRSFGPIMLLWFLFLGVAGVINIGSHWDILRAISPLYAIEILFSPVNKVGIFILGSIFLATTGAEALYSDMGHVGKANIYWTWPFVFSMLMLNYFGQGVWMLNNYNNPAFAHMSDINPFYEMVPQNFQLFAIIIATLAAVIASQALITGSFTLVNEAIILKFLPRLKITHPSKVRGQIYIGGVNWILFILTMGIVWFFQTSQHMEAAYGLAITITMLMTTILLYEFMRQKFSFGAGLTVLLVFGTLESVFLIASLTKFIHGGYLTLLLTLLILSVMYIWYFGNKRRESYVRDSEYVSLTDYVEQLQDLSKNQHFPIYATNLVYLAKVLPNDKYRVKRNVVSSILDRQPKRAKVYWFVTINETNEPFDSYYTVDLMGTENVISVQLYLGFKKNQNVNSYLRQIIQDLISENVIDTQKTCYGTNLNRTVGDFKYVIISQQLVDLGSNPEVKRWDQLLIGGRVLLQNITTSPTVWYGLEYSTVAEETDPLFTYRKYDIMFKQRRIINWKHKIKK